MLLNCGVGEDSGVLWKDWCWGWNSNTLATCCEELSHWKRPWCWERLRAGGEGDDRGWDGWMASSTRTWVWVDSGSWWWTGRPGVLRFMGSQKSDMTGRLSWTNWSAKDWEDEMAGWYHWLYGRESEWTPGVGDGQGGLACCDSWGRKVRHDWATELNWNTVKSTLELPFYRWQRTKQNTLKLVKFKILFWVLFQYPLLQYPLQYPNTDCLIFIEYLQISIVSHCPSLYLLSNAYFSLCNLLFGLFLLIHCLQF